MVAENFDARTLMTIATTTSTIGRPCGLLAYRGEWDTDRARACDGVTLGKRQRHLRRPCRYGRRSRARSE